MGVAVGGRISWRPWPLNPLDLRHAALPPNLVLAARVIAIALAVRGDTPFPPFLPYVGVIDAIGHAEAVAFLSRNVARLGLLLILLTPFVRVGAALTGVMFLFGLVACRPCHSVAHTFVACALVVISLSDRRWGSGLLRAQVVILYAGAALNKLFDPDWWNGRYFETLMVDRHGHAAYGWLASQLPPRSLSTVVGVLTIAAQAGIAAAVLSARTRRLALVTGVWFHGVMVLLLDNTFGPFVVTLLASYLAFVDWPYGRGPTAAVLAVAVLLSVAVFGGALQHATVAALLMGSLVWLIDGWRRARA